MKKSSSSTLTGLVISGLIAFGIISPRADMEPTDNTMGGATDVTASLLLAAQAVSGTISGDFGNGDVDYYKITNPGTVSKPLTVELSLFNLLAGEKGALTIFKEDGLTTIGGPLNTSPSGPIPESYASLTVSPTDFPAGATIIICVEGDSIPMGTPRSYSLSGKYYTTESETNDTPATADELPIYSENSPPCFGQGIISDSVIPDYWKITNTAADDKLEVTFVHSSGSEITRLRILKDDGFTEIFNAVTDINNKNIINAEIPNPAPGEIFFLCVEEDTQTMDVPYLIDVKGVKNPPAPAAAPNNAAAIAALERSCKKIRKKIRKAKSTSKKRRLKKKLKKCKKKLRALKG